MKATFTIQSDKDLKFEYDANNIRVTELVPKTETTPGHIDADAYLKGRVQGHRDAIAWLNKYGWNLAAMALSEQYANDK